jgi:UDP-N-acetyl-D-galactosamine dehydrogenase
MPHQRKISVSGLGYVGLTIATAFGQTQKVIGFDKDSVRIAALQKGLDKNQEISPDQLKTASVHYTANPVDLKTADFHIIAVPTPIDKANRPDFSILLDVTTLIGQQLKKGDIVVYESTVYPGITEEKCIPLLEHTSKLVCGKDFSVGYSPERINPTDKEHTFANITKIVSATDNATLDIVADVYESVVKAGVHRVSTIRVAEASKIIENTQRDFNISFANEIALILHSIGMDTTEVFAAARTKWNFLPFQPGLVGGHCVGVNAFYLAYKAEEAGYHPELIQSARRVNDSMAKFLAENTIAKLKQLNISIKQSRIAVLGLTYKENCSDVHESKVLDVIKELASSGAQILVHDPIADPALVKKEYGIELKTWEDLSDLDAIILTLAHRQYVELDKKNLKKLLKADGLIMDIKNILNPKEFKDTRITLWKL